MVVLGGFGVVASSYLGAYLLGKQAGRRETEHQRLLADDDVASAASLVRIETAVEAMALEVERLSEGQRWLLRPGSRPDAAAVPPRTPVPQHRTPA